MQIKIEIPNGEYCSGCPLVSYTHNLGDDNHHYYCGLTNKDLEKGGEYGANVKNTDCPYHKDGSPSEAMILLKHVWKYTNNSKLFSWERLNRTMSTALDLTIDSGMHFNDGDFDKIGHDFRMEYWGSYEGAYTQAVKSNNMSACKALESTLKRNPFIAKFPINLYNYGVGRTANRQEGRIAVGTSFDWQGECVTVTSFAKDQSYFNACSYHPYKNDGNYETRKIKHIFKITHEDLKKAKESLDGENNKVKD